MMRRDGGPGDYAGLTDTELVKRIQSGQRGLLEELTDRYLSAVYNRLVRLVPPSDVEDLTQEIMLAIVRSVNRFGGRSSVATWIHSIVNNNLKYYYRQRHHSRVKLRGAGQQDDEGDEGDAPPVAATDDEPLTRLMESDEQGAVARIVNGLRPTYQHVLRLRFTDEMAFKEIAGAMGLSLDAVKSLFRRAVSDVAKQLRRLRPGGRGISQ